MAADMSQTKLSEGICSLKYLYLIEKGTRTPSNIILVKMGDKLNVNFLEYYAYLDAEDPIAVKKAMDVFSECRRTLDFKQLATFQNLDRMIDDFNHIPWKFELEFNDALAKFFIMKDTIEARDSILVSISNMPEEYQYSPTHIRFLALLSLCYMDLGRQKSANFIIEQVMAELEPKIECNGFTQLYFMCAYIFMAIKIKSGQYGRVIDFSESVSKKQREKNFYGLIHINHLQRGYALSKMGHTDLAAIEIHKGLMAILSLEKHDDLDLLDRIGIVSEILDFGFLNRSIVSQIKGKRTAWDDIDKRSDVL